MGFSYDNIPDAAYEDVINDVFGEQALDDKPNFFNFVCPMCGDMHFPNKRKAYVYKNTWVFRCFKCMGEGTHIMSYLRENYPDQYDRLLFMAYDDDGKKIEKRERKQVVVNKDLPFEPGELCSIMDNNPLSMAGREFCKNRCIREAVYRKWYVCLPGSQFYKRDDKGQIVTNASGYPVGNEFKNRIVIPFYKFGGAWTQFDARAIDSNNPLRYRNFDGVKRAAYNIDFLDVTKPFYILEGTIDSTFIRNSIAIGGIPHFADVVKEHPEILQHKENCTVIWDNDKSGQMAMLKTTKDGFNWFNWSGITSKDVNAAVLKHEMPVDDKGYVQEDFIKSRSMKPEGASIYFALQFGDVDKQNWIAKKEAKKAAWERRERAKNTGVMF